MLCYVECHERDVTAAAAVRRLLVPALTPQHTSTIQPLRLPPRLAPLYCTLCADNLSVLLTRPFPCCVTPTPRRNRLRVS